jgi:hypothetical protein
VNRKSLSIAVNTDVVLCLVEETYYGPFITGKSTNAGTIPVELDAFEVSYDAALNHVVAVDHVPPTPCTNAVEK